MCADINSDNECGSRQQLADQQQHDREGLQHHEVSKSGLSKMVVHNSDGKANLCQNKRNTCQDKIAAKLSGTESKEANSNCKLNSLTTIMNRVIQETDNENGSSMSTGELPAIFCEESSTASASSLQILPLICSTRESLEKLHPKLVNSETLDGDSVVRSTSSSQVCSMNPEKCSTSCSITATLSPAGDESGTDESPNGTSRNNERAKEAILDDGKERCYSLTTIETQKIALHTAIVRPTLKKKSTRLLNKATSNEHTISVDSADRSVQDVTGTKLVETSSTEQWNENPCNNATNTTNAENFPSYVNDDWHFLSHSSLISPERTKILVDEATAHVRRRRPSSNNSLLSRAVSDSSLSRFSLVQKPQQKVKRQISSPLVSPARRDRLVRHASEHIRNNRLKRRSKTHLDAEGVVISTKESENTGVKDMDSTILKVKA